MAEQIDRVHESTLIKNQPNGRLSAQITITTYSVMPISVWDSLVSPVRYAII